MTLNDDGWLKSEENINSISHNLQRCPLRQIVSHVRLFEESVHPVMSEKGKFKHRSVYVIQHLWSRPPKVWTVEESGKSSFFFLLLTSSNMTWSDVNPEQSCLYNRRATLRHSLHGFTICSHFSFPRRSHRPTSSTPPPPPTHPPTQPAVWTVH